MRTRLSESLTIASVLPLIVRATPSCLNGLDITPEPFRITPAGRSAERQDVDLPWKKSRWCRSSCAQTFPRPAENRRGSASLSHLRSNPRREHGHLRGPVHSRRPTCLGTFDSVSWSEVHQLAYRFSFSFFCGQHSGKAGLVRFVSFVVHASTKGRSALR